MFSLVKIDKRPYHRIARDLNYKNDIYTYIWKSLRIKVTSQTSQEGRFFYGRSKQKFAFLASVHRFFAKTMFLKVVDENASNILESLHA